MEFHCKILTVTGNHRIVSGENETIITAKRIEAKHKVLKLNSSQFVELQKVTKRYANVSVMQLEFEGDATIATVPPTILTKGADRSVPAMGMEIGTKQEVMDEEGVNGLRQLTLDEASASDGPEAAVTDEEREPEAHEYVSTDDGF